MDTSRVCQPFRVQLLTTFHRRRYGVLQASIGLPLSKIQPRSAPPKNFILEAIRVKEFMALVYWGKDAIKKCRDLAGATNPEEADPTSIRGSYGRITTSGVYENVIHVSSNEEEAAREIKLWFKPCEIIVDLYPQKEITHKEHKVKDWA